MSIFSNKPKADYTRTLQKGITFVRSLRGGLTDDTGSRVENVKRLKNEIENADAIVIGGGAGLSTAAGFTYGGERFDRYFFDFKERLGLMDMYSGGGRLSSKCNSERRDLFHGFLDNGAPGQAFNANEPPGAARGWLAH